MKLHYQMDRGVSRIKNKFKQFSTRTALIAGLSVSALGIAFVPLGHASTPDWNVNGTYNFAFDYQGTPYVHQVTISGQDTSGNFNVSSTYPVGGPEQYAWSGTGTISGSALTMNTDYTAGAVGTHMDILGTVASNGTLSGTWSDNNIPGGRTGTWMSVSGTASPTHAASQVVVTPTNTQGWTTADTRTGGSVTYVVDSTAPGNPKVGALKLLTDATTTAKAQYMHTASTPLSDVTELSYSTKMVSGPVFAAASYQLPVCLGGVSGTTCNGFTTFVYEPYENGTVLPTVWQNWDVAAGQMWSSRTASGGGACATVAGDGGAPFYTLAALKTLCPNAVVVGFGVNIGSNNPSYNVEADLVNFNNTTYNFEPYVVATDKEACKNDGWKGLTDASGKAFKNQGDCVSFVATNGKNKANG